MLSKAAMMLTPSAAPTAAVPIRRRIAQRIQVTVVQACNAMWVPLEVEPKVGSREMVFQRFCRVCVCVCVSVFVFVTSKVQTNHAPLRFMANTLER